MSTTPNDNGWTTRMKAENAAAEATIASDDVFAPHNGADSDLNQHAADLLAEPDEASDPTRRT